MPGHPNHERADRILDAASELLVRWGSRKVTIDDVARRAGIGKGTVYLHWRTKDALFETLLTRAAADLLD
ncbi:MAG TPA: helix-turn-helix domain-containing protein, partial [Amycolatopsis sp.]